VTAVSTLTQKVTGDLRTLLAQDPSADRLNAALRHLAKWRSSLIANTLRADLGPVIRSGPFAGMSYDVPASEGSYPARLLGVYEASLHPFIAQIIAMAPSLIVDIGCAEGYYAVGLARALPGTQVWARDASPAAQDLCRRLAAQNGVTDRVQVGGLFTHADLAVCAARNTVLVVDIEGAEGDLLDPLLAPDLAGASILVECHDAFRPGLTDILAARFRPTHHVTRIDRRLDDSALPPSAEAWSDMDRLLALWEWRAGPTPWLWMEPRA
jgi:hypothetical protein